MGGSIALNKTHNTCVFRLSCRYWKRENTDYPEFYVYDSNGRLNIVAKLVTFILPDNSTIPIMYPITQYVWGPDRVLAKIDTLTNSSYYYLYNGHGDVVQIVDTAGNVVNSYDYDVWGNFLTKQETIDNHFTYFGQTYDETTGLYYLRARYYDPTTGRFTQQDPAEDGYNWYIYAGNNAGKYIDPSGESYGLTWGASTWWLAGADGPLPIGEAILVGGMVVGAIVDGVQILFSKKSKSSGKEKGNDIPSWAKGEKPKEGESGKDFAKRVCDKKFGKDNYNKGPGSDYNKLKKYGDRGGKQ